MCHPINLKRCTDTYFPAHCSISHLITPFQVQRSEQSSGVNAPAELLEDMLTRVGRGERECGCGTLYFDEIKFSCHETDFFFFISRSWRCSPEVVFFFLMSHLDFVEVVVLAGLCGSL